MTPIELLTLCEQRDLLTEQLRAVQAKMDEAYENIFSSLTLYEAKYIFFWQVNKTKRISVTYPSERDALRAFANNEIEWVER